MIGSSFHRELLTTLMQSQFWTREEIRQHQRRRLERLLQHARNYVPFYRERLARVVDLQGRVDWDAWNEVPMLTRQDLAEHGQEMRSTALPPGHGEVLTATTSGSTGAPITVSMTAHANIANQAALHRGQMWHEVNWSRDILFYTEEKTHAGVWPDAEVGPVWGPPWLPESTGRFLRFNGDTAPGHILGYMKHHDIRYLSCRAKVGQVLAVESIRSKNDVQFDALFAFSTATSEDEREDLSAAFGAKIINFYSSKEAHTMAYQCPVAKEHLHIDEELVLLELVDDKGRTTDQGTLGQVVVTNLFNWAQPIIRYAQEDLAVEGGSCRCGRSLRVLKEIRGRVTDMFRFPDGTAVAFAFPENVKREFGIKAWQVAQVGPMEIEVRYVAGTNPINEPRLAEAIRDRAHRAAEIRFVKTEAFLPVGGGKFVEYKNEHARRHRGPTETGQVPPNSQST